MTPGPGGSRARRIGGLVAGVLVVAFLALSVVTGWDVVSGYDWDVDPAAMAGSLLVLGVFLLFNGAGYVAILERVEARRLPRRRVLGIWARSILARYVPGNVLMVAGRVVLGREAGATGRGILAATVYEHALIIGLSACGAAYLLVFGNLGQDDWTWIVAVVPFGLVLLHPRLFGPAANWVLRRVGRPPLERLLSTREVLGFCGWYALTLAILGLGVWWFVRGLVGPQAGGPLFVGAGFLLSFVASTLAFIFPSGLGVREGVLALVLARHLPGEVAIAVSAAVRLALTVAEVSFTGLLVISERWTRPAATPRSAATGGASDD